MRTNLPKFIASIAISQIAGLTGALFTAPSIATWYPTLRKPSLTPPDGLFGPIWTILFTLMGVSFYLIWNSRHKNRKETKTALIIFAAQLSLNTLWPLLFFGLHSPELAFAEILLLWAAIWLTIAKFYKISKTAALMLIPYILWISFAAVLNLSISVIN